MSDLWRSLPLFGRTTGDESDIGGGWADELAAVRTAAEAALAAHPDTAAAAAFQTATRPPRARWWRRGGRVRLPELDRAVYAYLELCERLGTPPELPARASGAVALARAAAAPTAIRAVIAGHSLRATDAGWAFGRGPTLEATAAEMLQFLGGRSLTAPRPASSS